MRIKTVNKKSEFNIIYKFFINFLNFVNFIFGKFYPSILNLDNSFFFKSRIIFHFR
jgi:hypothetical protein